MILTTTTSEESLRATSKVFNLSINTQDAGKRLDAILTELLKEHSRSQIKRWIDGGNVRVGGKAKKTSYKVKAADEIIIEIPPLEELTAEPQNIPIDIVYEDSDLVVVNKSADMVVHPAAGNPDGTMVNALLYHCKDLSGIGGVLRPGIVHRLDKGTSGLIVVAKNDMAHEGLSAQFKNRKVEKIYDAIIYGVPKTKKGTIDMEIGRHPTDRKKMSTKTRSGKRAVTDWELIESFDKHLSLVKIKLITGRTHQIRVHFSARGMPLVGDATYGGKKVIKRLPVGKWHDVVGKIARPMLHAGSITFEHPRSGKRMKFRVDPPADFVDLMEELREI